MSSDKEMQSQTLREPDARDKSELYIHTVHYLKTCAQKPFPEKVQRQKMWVVFTYRNTIQRNSRMMEPLGRLSCLHASCDSAMPLDDPL